MQPPPNNVFLAPKTSLTRTLLFRLIILSFISILVLGTAWIYSKYASFQATSRIMKANYIDDRQKMLKLEVETAVDYINYMMAQTDARLRQTLKARVSEAHAIAENLYLKNQDRLTPYQMQALIREALRPIRFNGDRGYYFATDLMGIEQLFADRPELEGKNMLGLQGGRGEYVVRDMVALVKKQREGFYQYHWTKPGSPGNDNLKLAFVKLFEPFNWFIGTGEYIEDVTNDIQNEVLARIERIRFANDGYIFAGTWTGVSLSGPAKGRNMLDVQDANGVKIVQELINRAKGAGGSLAYVMPRFPGQKSAPKLSYVVGIPTWQWYVGSGIYIDEIDSVIEYQREQMWTAIKYTILKIVVMLAGLILVSVLIAAQLARGTRSQFNTFINFLARAAETSEPINRHEMQWVEFDTLAQSANRMLATREEARQSLLASEAKYRRLFEQSHDAIFVVEKSTGRYQDANNAALKLTGRTLSALEQLTIHDVTLHHTEKRFKITSTSTGPHALGEVIYVQPDGSQRVTELTSVPLNEQMAYWIARDITERKRAEEAVHKSEKRFRELADSLPQTVFETDAEGNLTFVNKVAFTTFGYDREDLYEELNALDMLLPAEHTEALKNLQGAIDGQAPDPNEYTALRKDGSTFPIIIHANPITQGPDVVGLRGIIIDLTRQKKMEAQLQQANKMEAIGTLAGGIAHDFNNILSALIGYTELSLDGAAPGSELENYLQGIYRGAMRAKDLVRQILTFARRVDEDLKPVKVSSVAKEVLKLMRSTTPSSITIQSQIDSEGLVMADLTQIHQIFMNLCTNAAYALEAEEGILEVRLTDCVWTVQGEDSGVDLEPGEYVKITIADTGKGIAPRDLPFIFEPYFTTKPTGEGTGLGLSVVHGIVKGYQGDILVASEPGHKTTFTIYLPAIKAMVETTSSATGDLPMGNERILFIDDEKSVTEVGGQILKRLGYRVTTQTSSKTALALFQSRPNDFDLIITDMTMPGISGDKLASKLIKIRPDIPIILCTGYSKLMSDEKADELGIRAFALKPLTLNDLAQTVRRVLDQVTPGPT